MNDEIGRINKEADDKELARKKANQMMAVDAVKGGLSAIASISEAFAGKSREQQRRAFKIQKAAGIASATIDTYKSAQAAFASAGNPILGAVFAAIAVAAGLVNIKKIASTKIDGGGSAPSGGGGGGASASAATQAVQPSFNFQGSGNNANNLSSKNDLSAMTIKAVVSETEVTSTQSKVKKFEQMSTL